MRKSIFVIFAFIAIFTLTLASCKMAASSGPTCTITYNANGESITMPGSQRVTVGVMAKLADLPSYNPDTAPVIFNGWNTEAGGTGSLWGAGDFMLVEDDITLYAEWSERSGDIKTVEPFTIKMEPSSHTSGWQAIVYPDKLFNGRIEAGGDYTLAYAFTSDTAVPTSDSFFCHLADTSGLNEADFGNDYVILVNTAVTLEGTRPLPANTEVKNMTRFMGTWIAKSAANNTAEANALSIFISGPSQAPTLTFTELVLFKSEEVKLTSLTANGASTLRRTTQILMEFDKEMPGLKIDDISIMTLGFGGIHPVLLSGGGKSYALAVDVTSAGVSGSFEVAIDIWKAGYIFNPNGKKVTCYTGTQDDEPLPEYYIRKVSANGGSSGKTTEIYIEVYAELGDLTPADITLLGIPGVTKGGTISKTQESNIYESWWRYTLPINIASTGGNLLVSFAKTGCIFNNQPWMVTVYPDYSGFTYDGYLGYGYDVINGDYYVNDQVKHMYALNMPKLKAENKIRVDDSGGTSTSTRYVTGETLEKYYSDFKLNAKVSGGFGFFSASASFGYNSSHQAEDYESFASLFVELSREKHFVNMSDITIADLRNNYLNENFKNNYLMNTSYTPAELFNLYGTHIFLEVDLGGRLDMSYVYHNHDEENAETIEAHVSASYMTVKGKVDTEINNESAKFSSESKEIINSYGGSVDQLGLTVSEARAGYSAWASNIENRQNLTIIRGGDLDNITQMVPIWELIDTSWQGGLARKKAIFDYANDLLDANGGKIFSGQKTKPNPPEPTYINGIAMASHSNNKVAESNIIAMLAPEPAVLVPGDLNAGKGSNRIRMGFIESTSVNYTIRDIKALKGNKNPPATMIIGGKTYILLAVNTNSTAGGDYVWLYCTKDSTVGAPLKNLYVEKNGDLVSMSGSGWTRVQWTSGGGVGADLKSGVSGVNVYLWMQR